MSNPEGSPSGSQPDVGSAGLQTPGAALPPGARLGKYVVSGVLGRGGMGVVYEAHDPMLDRRVAIKLLPESVSTDRTALARFVSEARAAGRLLHPNTVAVFEIGEQSGRHFLAMELVRGGSAADALAARGRLPWTEATRIVIDACKGMSAAHEVGLVHRDIKPANIMLNERGDVKLADFGLAKHADAGARSITGVGEVVGTPQYMAPEQCAGGAIDARTDVYSMGATYYTLLAGRSPYAAIGSAMQILYAQCHSPLPDPRVLAPDIPEGCVEVIRKAMAKKPAERHRSAAELIADLETLLAEGAEMAALRTAAAARRNSAAEATRTLATHPAPRVGAATAATAAVLPRTAPARRRSGRPMMSGAAVGLAAGAGVLAVVLGAVFFGLRSPRPAPAPARRTHVPGLRKPPRRSLTNRPPPEPTPPDAPVHDPPAVPPTDGPAEIDLLRVIDPAKDVVSGDWRLVGSALAVLPGNGARLQIPHSPPDEYDLELVVTRLSGNGPLDVGLVSGPAIWNVSIDGWPNRGVPIAGLHLLDGKPGFENETTRPGPFLTPQTPVTLRCRVRRGGVALECAGRPVFEWTGARERLSLHPGWQVLPRKDRLFLGAWQSAFRIDRIVLRHLAGDSAESPDGSIPFWAIIGPFAARGGEDLDFELPPDREFDPARRYPGRGGEVGWRPVPADDGGVSLVGLLGENDNSVAYTVVDIESPVEGKAVLACVFDDRGRVRLNGIDVGRGPGPVRAALDLRRGTNRLELKVGQSGFYWGFEAKVLGADGAPIPGLRWRLPPGVRFAPLTLRDPTPEAFARRIAGRQTGDRIEAVRERLAGLHPLARAVQVRGRSSADGRVIALNVPVAVLRDLSPLAALPELEALTLSAGHYGSRLGRDGLAPLAGLTRLRELTVEGAGRLADLEPLRGKPLESLKVAGCGVRDLSPLSGMRLTTLHIGGGNPPVADLSPLRGMDSLRELNIAQTAVRDLSPLRGMALERLWVPVSDAAGAEVVRSLPNLRLLNGRPAAEAMTELDARFPRRGR